MIWRYSNETQDGRAGRIVREKKKSKVPLFERSHIRGLPSSATFGSRRRESLGIRRNEDSPKRAVYILSFVCDLTYHRYLTVEISYVET